MKFLNLFVLTYRYRPEANIEAGKGELITEHIY